MPATTLRSATCPFLLSPGTPGPEPSTFVLRENYAEGQGRGVLRCGTPGLPHPDRGSSGCGTFAECTQSELSATANYLFQFQQPVVGM